MIGGGREAACRPASRGDGPAGDGRLQHALGAVGVADLDGLAEPGLQPRQRQVVGGQRLEIEAGRLAGAVLGHP